jgi:APA family basic amino acid/polyamine antiporter
VLALAAVNYHGVTRTARLTRIIVTIVLAALALVLTVILARGGGTSWTTPHVGGPSVTGILQSAALLFFAFAGYARIATMGEEVIDPRRTIPRAVLIAFAIVVPLYAVTALALLGALGPDDLAASLAPLQDAAAAVDAPGWVGGLVVVAAVSATLGALLALIAGVGRTVLAMARNRDLPGPLAAVHERYAVPHVAEMTLALVVCGLIVVADLREAVGFSSFGVLTYYAVANAAALTQDPAHRRYPRWVQVVGLLGCVVLALAVPTESLVPGLVVLAVGLAGRALVGQRRSRRDGDRHAPR